MIIKSNFRIFLRRYKLHGQFGIIILLGHVRYLGLQTQWPRR